MIRIKTKQEIEIIREGGKILNNVLVKLGALVKPGLKTGELESLANELINKAGGRPAFKDYQVAGGEKFPTALCVSINDEIVHCPSIPSRVLKSGDIVGIDIGMEYPINSIKQKIVNKYSENGGYYTDMAKTFAVGKISSEAKKLLKVTQKSLFLGIGQVRPGNTLNDIGKTIEEFVKKEGFSVVRELVGHGVGHKVHEEPQVPNYEISIDELDNYTLETGMVIAIEPMVNTGDWRIRVLGDDISIATKDGSLSAHFEHTIAVTDNGYEILTAA